MSMCTAHVCFTLSTSNVSGQKMLMFWKDVSFIGALIGRAGQRRARPKLRQIPKSTRVRWKLAAQSLGLSP
jgi:hypothetical protein